MSRWFRRKKQNSNETAAKLLCKCFAANGKDQEEKKIPKKARTSHTHTHTHSHSCSVQWIESRFSHRCYRRTKKKKKKHTSHCFSVRLCDRRCGAFLKVPISHKFAIIHSSDAILVFCRLRFIAPRSRARSAHMDFIALSAVHWPQLLLLPFYYTENFIWMPRVNI